jgi:5'-nucleotidase (lipoprotein e(P4) family)
MLLFACATPATHPVSAPTALHWFHDSIEQRAVYTEVYRDATASARRNSAGLTPGSWGVILDVDETILDNSEYRKALALTGREYSDATWTEWVNERRAVRLPGSKEFIDAVRGEMHGKVILVSNRKESQCTATEENLHHELIDYDRIVCKPDSQPSNDKNARFESIRAGSPGNPALKVLIWVGDNIEDFPGLHQRPSPDLSGFGVTYFVLPNPMYGSWEGAPTH